MEEFLMGAVDARLVGLLLGFACVALVCVAMAVEKFVWPWVDYWLEELRLKKPRHLRKYD